MSLGSASSPSSVRRRGVVLAVWAAILAARRCSRSRKLSVDAVPDVTNTQVSVLTSAPGLSPAGGRAVPHLPHRDGDERPARASTRSARSAAPPSRPSPSSSSDGTNIWFARQLVTERLKLAETDIPPGYGRPELAPVSTGLGEIYEFYLVSKRHTPMELRTLLDWVVALQAALRARRHRGQRHGRRGQAVPGRPRPQAPGRLPPVAAATSTTSSSATTPRSAAATSRRTASRSSSAATRSSAASRTSRTPSSPSDARRHAGAAQAAWRTVQTRAGAALRRRHQARRGRDRRRHGDDADRRQLARGRARRQGRGSPRSRSELPEGVEIRSYYDRAEFIDRMLKTVAINLAEGAGLVVVVLFLTLGSFRGSLIAALAIPLAMGDRASSAWCGCGVTGNLMSLGAIDFGLLVDGAIVMLEVALVAARASRRAADARRRRRRRRRRRCGSAARPVTFSLLDHPAGLPAAHGARGRRGAHVPADGDHRRAGAGGRAGVLADRVPGAGRVRAVGAPSTRTTRTAACSARSAARYGARARRACWRGPARRSPARRAASLVAARRSARTLGAEFVPRLDEGELSLDIKRLPSISITEAQRLGVQVEEVLARFPEVLSVVTRTGRAEVATDPVGPDETEVMVKLRPKKEWTTAHDLDDLGEAIKDGDRGARCPPPSSSVSQPIEDRVNQLLAGSRADVVIKVFGDDLDGAQGDRRRDRPGGARRAGPRRLARAARAGPAAARGDARSPAPGPLRHAAPIACWRWSRRRASGASPARSSRASRRFDLMLLLPPAHADARGLRRAAGRHARRAAGPAGRGRRPSARPRARRSSTASRCSGACSSRPTCAGAIWSASSTRRRRGSTRQVKLPARRHLEWGGQFENFTRANKRLGLVVPMALAIIFGDAVPDVRRRCATRVRGVRRRAAARWSAASLALVHPRAAVLDPGGGRLHRRGRASRC